MNRFFIRWAAFAAASAALALTSAGAFAQASIILNDPNCLSFTLTGTAPNQTLTCVQSSTPLCTISGPVAGTIGTPITLNNTCVPAATSYTWSGGNCNSNTSKNCSDPGTNYVNNQVVTYTVTGTNGAGPGPASAGWQVTWTNTAPAAPSGCSIAQAPTGQLPAGGGAVTLTASCTTGSGITWAWQGGFAQGLTGNQVSGNVSASQVFTATATNSSGSSQASLTVTVSGGGGGGGITCTGYAHTKVLDLSWASVGKGSPIIGYSSQAGGFGGTDAFIMRFTTPSGTSPDNLGSVSVGEFAGVPSTTYAKLSNTACDFSGAIGSQTPEEYFSVGSNSFGANQLAPNTTYYFNMHHDSGCTGTCDVIVTLQKPSGI